MRECWGETDEMQLCSGAFPRHGRLMAGHRTCAVMGERGALSWTSNALVTARCTSLSLSLSPLLETGRIPSPFCSAATALFFFAIPLDGKCRRRWLAVSGGSPPLWKPEELSPFPPPALVSALFLRPLKLAMSVRAAETLP